MAQLEVTSPYDGSTIAALARADETTIEQALERAYSTFRSRSGWLPVHRRVEILEAATGLMAEQREALALQAASEGGKPLTDSLVEVDRAIDGVRLAAETIRAEAGEVIPVQSTAAGTDRVAFTQFEPIGVVVAVSAFNHPLNLIVHQVAAAVTAGCPVIVKPADDTPLSCQSFVEILHRAGLPEQFCQLIVLADIPLAERMVTDPRVGFFSFIGSAKVGWMLRSELAPGTRCALEHGGAAPLSVADDADLDLALAAVTKGGFYHAGQVCVSVQRVIAHRSLAQDFAERLAAQADDLKVGDPRLSETDVGPLIRAAEVERVNEWVGEAVTGGAKLLCGGQPL